VETDFDRERTPPASDHWSPPPAEPSYRDEPREQSGPSAEPGPSSSDERQAS
jgi:hypothetical protein